MEQRGEKKETESSRFEGRVGSAFCGDKVLLKNLPTIHITGDGFSQEEKNMFPSVKDLSGRSTEDAVVVPSPSQTGNVGTCVQSSPIPESPGGQRSRDSAASTEQTFLSRPPRRRACCQLCYTQQPTFPQSHIKLV